MGNGLLGVGKRDRHRPLGLRPDGHAVLGHSRGCFQGREGAAGVSPADADEVLAGVVGEDEFARQAALVGGCGVEDVGDLSLRERAQGDEHRARQQRCDHREGRVLGGGRHEDDLTILDSREQGVLLGLGEAVDLVEEEHRLASVEVTSACRLVHDGSDVLDACRHRGELDELAVRGRRHEVGQRRLARARWPPDDRGQRSGRARASGDQPTQGASGTQHVGLAAHLLDRAWAHPDGQRRQGRDRLLGLPGRRSEEIAPVQSTHPPKTSRGRQH